MCHWINLIKISTNFNKQHVHQFRNETKRALIVPAIHKMHSIITWRDKWMAFPNSWSARRSKFITIMCKQYNKQDKQTNKTKALHLSYRSVLVLLIDGANNYYSCLYLPPFFFRWLLLLLYANMLCSFVWTEWFALIESLIISSIFSNDLFISV